MDSLAARLKTARTVRKLTQIQLAAAAGMAQSDISKLERGDSLTSVALPSLARALQCDVDWLDTGDGEPDYGRVRRGWPFPRVDRARFVALTDRDQAHVETRLLVAIEECEAKTGIGAEDAAKAYKNTLSKPRKNTRSGVALKHSG